MVEIGRLSPAERATYTTFPEPKPPHRANSAGGQDGYLVQLAEAYAKRAGHIPDARFDLGGYQIYTTFEKPRMTALTRAVREARGALDPERRKADRSVRFGAASVAPDGRILAVYGGPDYERQAFNESNAGTVPAGSAFTPSSTPPVSSTVCRASATARAPPSSRRPCTTATTTYRS